MSWGESASFRTSQRLQKYGAAVGCRIGDDRQVPNDETENRRDSRLALFHVCLFVTASEGEELVVNVRHGG